MFDKQKQKILSAPKGTYSDRIMEAAKTGKLTPALLQEGQTIDILENVADLSLVGGGSIRSAREGAESIATSGIEDFATRYKSLAGEDELGLLFQQTLAGSQKAFKATNPIGNAKEDWKIFNLIVDKIKNKNLFANYKTLIEDSLSKIKENKNIDTLPEPQTKKINLASGNFYSEEVSIRPIDYYFSNPVARASKTMSDCRLEKIRNLENRKTG